LPNLGTKMVDLSGGSKKLADAIALLQSVKSDLDAPVPTQTTTTPTPAPVPVVTTPKLRWAPPKLTNPITKQVTAGVSLKLDKTKDYVLELPKTGRSKGTLSVYGGHHVVVVGGSIDASGTRALYLQNQTGDVHFEGVDFYADSANALHEGCDISWPEDPGYEQNITFQNCTSSTSDGSYGTYHSDWLQIWNISNAKTNLRIANCDVKTGYQGIMLQPKQFGDATFQRIELHDFVIRKTQDSGYCIYATSPATPENCTWVTSNVTLVTTTGDNKGQGLYPELDSAKQPMLARVPGIAIAKDALTTIIGKPGAGYVSPGYAA
jgi:hypothetical protein